MSELTDLWPRIRALAPQVERPSRYIDHEWGSVYKPEADFHFCMIYPDVYEVGQPNQALRILVNVVNAREGMSAERGFLPAPDMAEKMREQKIPLFSVESCAPVREFDAVGITLPHELAATNVLETLDLAGIALHAVDRAEEDPIVLAGGPCAFNPEPYAPFFDAFNIGEGEVILPDGLELIRRMRAQGASRHDILATLGKEPGWYVPSFYRWRTEEEAQAAGSWIEPLEEGMPTHITKQLFNGFAESPGWEPCIVPFTEAVHDRLNVEILRGCARGCRFCQAGMMYRPVRERSADNVVQSVLAGLKETGYDEVSLTSLSTTDHSQIAEILTRLNEACDGTGVRVSIPSQRLDSFGAQMAALVAGKKKGGLTFAPEAGTQRLRDVINKNVTEENLFSAIDAAFAAGWRRCKLYFMVGLPTETDDDLRGIASLCERAYDRAVAAVSPDQKGAVQISASLALFVPKAQTPFQWDGQIPPEEAIRRVNLVRSSVKRRSVVVHWHNAATSFIEAIMSRSGREAAALIEEAWKRGAKFDAWDEFFDEEAWKAAEEAVGIDVSKHAQTTFPLDYVLPWEHVSTGVSLRYLKRERELAEKGITTPDCTFERCSGCGVCPGMNVDNELASPRVLGGVDAANVDGDDCSVDKEADRHE